MQARKKSDEHENCPFHFGESGGNRSKVSTTGLDDLEIELGTSHGQRPSYEQPLYRVITLRKSAASNVEVEGVLQQLADSMIPIKKVPAVGNN